LVTQTKTNAKKYKIQFKTFSTLNFLISLYFIVYTTETEWGLVWA